MRAPDGRVRKHRILKFLAPKLEQLLSGLSDVFEIVINENLCRSGDNISFTRTIPLKRHLR